jgi:predicted transcriptional regulator
VAFPFQKTLAAKLEVDERTVRRYVRELVQAGELQVTKRQHSSALYEIQTGQNVRSDVRSDVRSKPRFLNEKKLSTSEMVWPKPMGTATQNSPEMERVFEWAKEHGYPV